MIRPALLALSALSAATLAVAAPAAPAERWTPAWLTAPIGYEPQIKEALGRPFRNESVRQEIYVGTAGTALRLRLGNDLGEAPLAIGGASVVRLDAKGQPVAETLRPLLFNGSKAAIIPARAPMLTDAVAMPVRAGDRLAVTLYFPGEAAPPAHAQMVDVSAGDQTAALALPAPRRARAPGLVTGVEVSGGATSRVLVAFGDSITEGAGSSPGRAMSYPEQLGRMLAAGSKAGSCWAVGNAGISGNRLLHDGRGPNALARFDRDALSVPGVTHVLLLEGINDIGMVGDPAKQDQQVSAERIIGAYRQLLARAKARGVKVIIGTLLPYEGAAYAYAEGEERRQTVNGWIRDNAAQFDGLVDFDKAMQEPGKPSVMRLAEQIGDHLHPNDAGYTRMAKTALPAVVAQGCGR